jgi:hypothetical protein
MQRRRRLRIEPVPGPGLPQPDDPALPDVAPRQPVREPETPAEPDLPDLPAPVPPRDPRDCRSATWQEPHLWAALRAQLDAGRELRLARLAAVRREQTPLHTPVRPTRPAWSDRRA